MDYKKTVHECRGNGECLEQTFRFNRYGTEIYAKSKSCHCAHNCKPIKCKNYTFCRQVSPQCYLDCDVEGKCTACSYLSIPILDENKHQIECPVCLEENLDGIKLPNCSHYVCIKCFNEMFSCLLNPNYEIYDRNANAEDYPPKPPFPIPERKRDYDDDDEKAEELDKDPRVIEWNERIDQWQEVCDAIIEEKQARLGRCPLCRRKVLDLD